MNIPISLKINNIWESIYPFVLALLTFLFLLLIYPNWLTEISVCRILSSPYLTIFSVCFAFIFSSLSFLLCLTGNSFFRGMKQTGALEKIIKYHKRCITWCFFAMILGVVVLFWSESLYSLWHGSFFIAIGIGALSSTWRIFSLFFKVIEGAIF